MRILLVNTYVGPGAGGQERVALDLALGLREAGHNVVVLAPYSNSPPLLRRIPSDVPLCEAPWRDLAPGRRESHLRLFTSTLHLIRRHGIQIVSGHGRMFGVYGACRVSGVPLVWTWHGADPSAYVSPSVKTRAIRSMLRFLADDPLVHFVAVSNFTKSCFQQILGRDRVTRLLTIPNGLSAIPALLQLPPPEFSGALKIGFVGRLEEIKGIFDLPVVARELARRGIAYRLLVFGDGSMEKELRARLAGPGIDPLAISFRGYEPDLGRIYSAFDVFLQLAPNEWLGLTNIEALAAARPVVGYNSGGTPEVVRDGHHGCLCAPGDTSGIVERLVQLYRDPETAKGLGQNGRAWARKGFSLERMTSDYLELFSRIQQTQRSR